MEPLPALSDIKRRRVSLGWSQGDLGKAAEEIEPKISVSRSAVAHIERGQGVERSLGEGLEGGGPHPYVPSYLVAKAIFEALGKEEERRKTKGIGIERVAKFAISPVRSVTPTAKISEAKDLMIGLGFSWTPVIDGQGVCRGTITEGSIVSAVEKYGTVERAYRSSVEEFMGDPLPVVGEKTLLASVMPLLEAERAVLVSKRGEIWGIVTPWDVMQVNGKQK